MQPIRMRAAERSLVEGQREVVRAAHPHMTEDEVDEELRRYMKYRDREFEWFYPRGRPLPGHPDYGKRSSGTRP